VSRRPAPPSGWPPPVEAVLAGEPVALEPLAVEVAGHYFARFPGDLDRYGEEVARAWALHDTQHLINWAIGDAAGFVDLGRQVDWLAGVLAARDFPLEQLAANLELCAEVVALRVPGGDPVAGRLREAAEAVRRRPGDGPTEERPVPA
jgi:hypothetical protein